MNNKDLDKNLEEKNLSTSDINTGFDPKSKVLEAAIIQLTQQTTQAINSNAALTNQLLQKLITDQDATYEDYEKVTSVIEKINKASNESLQSKLEMFKNFF